MKTIFSDEYKLVLRQLIDARKDAGFSQSQLAEKLQKPQSFVSKYERAERRLDIVELVKISKLLEIDPHLIIQGIEKELACTKKASS